MATTNPSDSTKLEQALRVALRFEPSPAVLNRIDRSVGLAAAATTAAVHRPFRVVRWRPLAILVGSLVLLSAAASALTLLQQAASLDPRWADAYERAERLDATQAIQGYTVTLERGYLDSDLLLLAIRLEGPSGTFPALPMLEVTDDQGRSFAQIGSGTAAESGLGEGGTVWAFEVPAGVGDPGSEVRLSVVVEPLVSQTADNLASTPAWFGSSGLGGEPDLVGPWSFQVTLHAAPSPATDQD